MPDRASVDICALASKTKLTMFTRGFPGNRVPGRIWASKFNEI
jgi:hypothetical protein